MADTSRPLPYTSNPILLFVKDFGLFARNLVLWPGLFGLIIPVGRTPTGQLDELYPTPKNAWSVALHVLLSIAQIAFLASLLPFAVAFPTPIIFFLYIAAFVLLNRLSTFLLNGLRKTTLYKSHDKYVEGRSVNPREKWIFINGVAVGTHWLQANLDRLALTFRRPIYGIHNRTCGIIFDVIECIIQRDFGYATLDIRTAYASLVEILANNDIDKVVLIVHSQGAIEGGLVLDWLYATVAASQLSKLEVYTFGNAANHWNAPASNFSTGQSSTDAQRKDPDHSGGPSNSRPPPSEREKTTRIIKYIEHYANTLDYVALGGILHFRPDPPPPTTGGTGVGRGVVGSAVQARQSTDAVDSNRFVGRLFKRTGPGHLLNQHYLEKIFVIDSSDATTGRVLDTNDYVEQLVDKDVFELWDTVQVPGTVATRTDGTKIKDLSRLWRYRNGGSPEEAT